MSCDLEVDTDHIRRAAALLRAASDAFRGHRTPRTYPSEHGAGTTAEGRQALRLTQARTAQAAESAVLLATAAEHLAEMAAAAAQRFDAAEAACLAGR